MLYLLATNCSMQADGVLTDEIQAEVHKALDGVGDHAYVDADLNSKVLTLARENGEDPTEITFPYLVDGEIADNLDAELGNVRWREGEANVGVEYTQAEKTKVAGIEERA